MTKKKSSEILADENRKFWREKVRYALSRFICQDYEASCTGHGFDPGDKATYLGHLIPTIMGLQCKLRQSTDKLVAPLVKALIAGIDMRFKSVLSDKDHLIATVLL